MSRKIQLLSEILIDQIAAGEVIENPASVVKELVENAIDAKAKRICVTIRGGGFQEIRIEDDGVGMGEEDLDLSIQRHATSKIRQFEDLHQLQSMGFRGEALASIAAVSHIRIESCEEGASSHFIECEGGVLRKKGLFARTRGTTIDIKDLFYNVPARKKFQKSIGAAQAEIHRVLNRLALGYPELSFTFIAQEKTVFQYLEEQNVSQEKMFEKRICDVLGKSFFSSLQPIVYETNFLTIRGYISVPSHTKPNRTGQFLFVNRRFVFSPLVSQAVRDGYGVSLGEGMFPLFILQMSLLGEWIDVNVHPQKREIRFREEKVVREQIQRAVSSTWQGFQKKSEFCFRSPIHFENPSQFLEANKLELERFFPPKEPQQTNFLDFCKKETESGKEKKVFYKEILLIGPYLILEEIDFLKKVFLVDLNAAYARGLFDLFKRSFLEESKKNSAQMLMIPLVLTFSSQEIKFLELFSDKFLQMGIEIRVIGKETLSVESIPPFMEKEDLIKLFSSILQEQTILLSSQKILEDLFKRMAKSICRFTKARKNVYSLEEAKKILSQLFLEGKVFQGLLGDPIMIELKEENLSGFFGLRKSLRESSYEF